MNTRTPTASTYVAILGLVAFAALFAVLGSWQLGRADESSALLAAFAAGGAEAPLEVLPHALDAAQRFRRATASGELVEDPQFLLDNRVHAGVPGYEVLTALRVSGVRERLLVNRGWVAANPDRRVLPDVPVDGGPRSVRGRLERLPRPGLRLGESFTATRTHGLIVLQYPEADVLAALLGEPVFDYQLLLDADEPGGYVRDWQAPGVPRERHLAYAGQWLALAIGAAAAAIAIGIRAWTRRS